MNKQKFVEQMQTASSELKPEYVDTVVRKTLDRLYVENEAKALEFERGSKMQIAVMEEAAELTEAIAHKLRGRTEDNYEILEESADVILNVLCTCKLFGISTDDLQKALMVKCKRQEEKKNWNA